MMFDLRKIFAVPKDFLKSKATLLITRAFIDTFSKHCEMNEFLEVMTCGLICIKYGNNNYVCTYGPCQTEWLSRLEVPPSYSRHEHFG